MRAFALRPSKQAAPDKSTALGRVHLRSLAARPSAQAEAEGTGARPAAAAAARFGHDFSRIPVNVQGPLRIQRKPAAGAPGDEYEQEADRVAEQVAGVREPPQTSPTFSHEAPKSAATARGGGRPLDAGTRAFMESRFGRDFGGVLIHTDSTATESARSLNALAYTAGRDIVFGAGQYAPNTAAGRRLLAHELAHVAQQSRGGAPSIQRKDFFGPTAGAPADWKTKVEAAKTSAERAALIGTAVGLTVSDATAASATDASPTAAHLTEYSASSQTVNYDEGLNSKTSPVDNRALTLNAGYTLHKDGKFYIILGPKALDADRYYEPLTILNHEFDHVRQELGGSKLKGNESELDAWTSSFIRDFHRTYLLGDTGATCFVQSVATFTPLLDYYHRRDVSDVQRDASAKRIEDYYRATVSGHEGHKAAFKFWVHRSVKNAAATPNLAERINTDLSLGVNASDDLKITRQFTCSATVKGLTYTAPTIDKPTFPTPTAKPTAPPPKEKDKP